MKFRKLARSDRATLPPYDDAAVCRHIAFMAQQALPPHAVHSISFSPTRVFHIAPTTVNVDYVPPDVTEAVAFYWTVADRGCPIAAGRVDRDFAFEDERMARLHRREPVWVATATFVARPYRRQGVATKVWTVVRDFVGKVLWPDTSLSPEGEAFWRVLSKS